MHKIGSLQIQQILAVTDTLGIHRESVAVPLATRGEGSVRVTEANRVEIVAPSEIDFELWLGQLPERLRQLDLRGVRTAE